MTDTDDMKALRATNDALARQCARLTEEAERFFEMKQSNAGLYAEERARRQQLQSDASYLADSVLIEFVTQNEGFAYKGWFHELVERAWKYASQEVREETIKLTRDTRLAELIDTVEAARVASAV